MKPIDAGSQNHSPPQPLLKLLIVTAFASATFCLAGTTYAQSQNNQIESETSQEDLNQEKSSEQQEEKKEQKHDQSIIDVTLGDGEQIKGRLCLPEGTTKIRTTIVFVHGTGPGTYLTKRKFGDKELNYFDFLANEFNDRGIGFFSYNKRGVTNSDKPPYYDQVDREKFRKVTPLLEADDLAPIIKTLKQNSRVSESQIILLGWSEGTIVAAVAAEKHPDSIDAIFLAGYAHENIYDIITWQFSGAASMINLNPTFDKDEDGQISQDEYDSGDEIPKKFRKQVMKGAEFEVLDADKNGQLNKDDFAIHSKFMHQMLLHNTADGNEDWIWNNYFRISIPWLQEHFALEPNKTRLTRLDLPIHIFHGTNDAHVDVKTVEDLKRRFESLNKKNLETYIFEDHEHNLNFARWATHDEMSEGFKKIFEVASKLDRENQD